MGNYLICAENQSQSEYCHSDNERSFVGTWVTDEVKKALEIGYEVIDIYDVWYFDNISNYEPTTMTGGLFTEYVNTFQKLKQEASGCPQWAGTI